MRNRVSGVIEGAQIYHIMIDTQLKYMEAIGVITAPVIRNDASIQEEWVLIAL